MEAKKKNWDNFFNGTVSYGAVGMANLSSPLAELPINEHPITAYHVLSTTPYMEENCEKEFSMRKYAILTAKLSARCWRRYNGPIYLVTDERGAYYAKKIGLDLEYNGIKVILMNSNSGILTKKFWASAKVLALRKLELPCAIIDMDLIYLKGTLTFFMKQFVLTGRKLDLESCRKICKRENDIPAIEQLNHLIGMKKVKDAMERFLNLNQILEKTDVLSYGSRLEPLDIKKKKKRINLHFVLVGNKGTGKTTVAKLIGEILCEYGFLATGHTVMTTPAKLMGSYVGESEKNIMAAIHQAMGGVLFIDEAYELLKTEASGIVTQLVADMDYYKGEFSVILAGYPDSMEALMKEGNEGLKGRFGENFIQIDDYTPLELVEIFHLMVRKEGFLLSAELEKLLPSFIQNWYYDKKNTDWANARQMENLMDSMRKRCSSLTIDADFVLCFRKERISG